LHCPLCCSLAALISLFIDWYLLNYTNGKRNWNLTEKLNEFHEYFHFLFSHLSSYYVVKKKVKSLCVCVCVCEREKYRLTGFCYFFSGAAFTRYFSGLFLTLLNVSLPFPFPTPMQHSIFVLPTIISYHTIPYHKKPKKS